MASNTDSSYVSPSPSVARRTIATYSSYEEAERAVDSLSDQKFPVERVAIVGTGLRSVEQVVGRATTGRAALTGAGQGALIGLFIARGATITPRRAPLKLGAKLGDSER